MIWSIFAADILCIPLPVCSFSFWGAGLSSEWDCCFCDQCNEGAGREYGGILFHPAKVMLNSSPLHFSATCFCIFVVVMFADTMVMCTDFSDIMNQALSVQKIVTSCFRAYLGLHWWFQHSSLQVGHESDVQAEKLGAFPFSCCTWATTGTSCQQQMTSCFRILHFFYRITRIKTKICWYVLKRALLLPKKI